MKIVSAKFLVSPNTYMASNPKTLTLELPLPVLKRIGVVSRIGASAFLETTCGFRISAPGIGAFIPDPASNDSMISGANPHNIIPSIPFSYTTGAFQLDDIDVIIPGPPYRIKIELQNADGANTLYGALFFWCDENKNTPPLKLVETPNNEH